MQVLDLPNKILLLIGEALPDRGLSSLARTSRFLYVLLNDHLYRRAARTDPRALIFSIENGLENNVARLLRLTPRDFCLKEWHGLSIYWRFALHRAVKSQQLGITRRILEHEGAQAEGYHKDKIPFTVALDSQNIDMLQLLLQHGFSVNLPKEMGASGEVGSEQDRWNHARRYRQTFDA